MIEDLLKNLGLREEEVKTYLALLETGPRSASDVSRHTGQPRPSVYGWLERLVQAGLVTQSQKLGVKLFIAEPPSKLNALFQRRIKDMQSQHKQLEDLLPDLEKRAGLNLLRPRLQFFEGRSGLESALEDVLAYPNGTTLSFWPIKNAIEATSVEFFRYLNIERVKRNVFIKAIWPATYGTDEVRFHFMGTGEVFKREVRIAPAGVDFTMGYWIYANKVLFISSSSESYGFIVESKDLSQMMASQHQLIWGLSKPWERSPTFERLFSADLAGDA